MIYMQDKDYFLLYFDYIFILRLLYYKLHVYIILVTNKNDAFYLPSN